MLFNMREGIHSSDMLSSEVKIISTIDETLIQSLVHPISNKWTAMFGCVSAFVSGVLIILLVEALIVMFIVLRAMEKKGTRPSTPHTSSVSIEIPDNSLIFALQGGVWIAPLPPGDVKKMYTKREKALREKAAKEQKSENENGSKESKSKKDALKDYIHVSPVWRYARLQGRILHLSCQAVKESILLEGCEIVAISGSVQPGRKWAKKYPLKLHHGSRHIYGGSNDCLLYLETGWEKEAWCEVLRASAKWTNDTDDWYFKLKKEYQEYTLRVQNQFPFLSGVQRGNIRTAVEEKPKIPKSEIAPNTKKRLLWKKLTRRSIKGNRENKSSSGREDSKKASSDDADDGSSSSKGVSISNPGDSIITRTVSLEDLSGRDATDPTQKTSRSSSHNSNGENSSARGERDSQGVLHGESLEKSLLCGNMLFARLFFDLYHSSAVVTHIRATLQRQLAKVPTPSYIGSINCTHLDLGNSPPLAQNLRLLPLDSNGAWGLEADVEYYGGAILTIETRIDVRDSNAREKVVVQGIEQTLTGSATTDLLAKGLENLKTDFHIAVDEGGTAAEQRNADGTSTSSRPADIKVSEEVIRKGWMHSSITNVKAMMSRVAEQVSQVPLALTIRLVQFKGTLQVRIKPPPSDRVWFSFVEMPILELVPEPCIGDHKINSGPLGTLIVNQIKVLIRDSMVFPQCEDLRYSWMTSEPGNWLPRDAVPLAFVPDQVQSDQSNQKERRETQLRRESSVDNMRIDPSGVGPSNSLPGIPFQYTPDDSGSPFVLPSRVISSSVSLPVNPPSIEPIYDLTTPLLGKEEKEELILEESNKESQDVVVVLPDIPPQSYYNSQAQAASSSDSDSGPMRSEELGQLESGPTKSEELGQLVQEGSVRGSKRAKVLTFGKKVGTKLDQKRRSVLEKMWDRSSEHPHG